MLDRERIVFYDMAALDLIVKRYGLLFIRELYRAAPALRKGTKQPKGASAASLKKVTEEPKVTSVADLELVSVEALAFFLFAGLLAEAKSQGEQLTLAQVQAWLVPMALPRIFNAVVLALTITTTAPVNPGKADAETARPATPAKVQRPQRTPERRTSATSSGSRTAKSAGRKRSSGKRRRGSSS